MTRSTIAPQSSRTAARTDAARRPATRHPAVRYCDASGRAVHGRAVQGGAVQGGAVPRRAGYDARAVTGRNPSRRNPAMRLTRRGRALLVLLAAALLFVVFSMGRATSRAGSYGARAPGQTIVIQRGETLWQVARRIAPDTDPRVTVQRIIELNDLGAADLVRPGQQLVLPG